MQGKRTKGKGERYSVQFNYYPIASGLFKELALECSTDRGDSLMKFISCFSLTFFVSYPKLLSKHDF